MGYTTMSVMELILDSPIVLAELGLLVAILVGVFVWAMYAGQSDTDEER
jgi:nitrogen fixation-related uncharacterized protein